VISPKVQERRLWKLRVAKAILDQEQLHLGEIRRMLGGTVLDGVLNECYAIHATDPEEAAKMARALLHARHLDRLPMSTRRRE
jgi:hypothetical protein